MRAQRFELKHLRNRMHVFRDRGEAGAVLADMLREHGATATGSQVLAIPSGGVPVGKVIAKTLGLPFDLIIVRKLQIPGNTEAGYGAMSLDGSLFMNNDILSRLRLTPARIEQERRVVAAELARRNDRFREGRPFPDLSGKQVILVDDGLASGFTMMAAVHAARQGRADRVMVAVPTAPLRTIEKLEHTVDAICCANIRDVAAFAVADAYQYWHDLTDADVLKAIEKD